MNCRCHDEPAYWCKDSRYSADGYWRCAVKHRASGRVRYATNPIYRIEQNLRDRRIKGLRRMAARQEASRG